MCAHEGMQVRGERIVGVWMQLTSMAARRVDDIVVCRDGSMCKCLHKHSAPERRAQARAVQCNVCALRHCAIRSMSTRATNVATDQRGTTRND